jgi:hypothetical protein
MLGMLCFSSAPCYTSPGEDDDGSALKPWEPQPGFPTPVSGVNCKKTDIFIKEKTMDEQTMPEQHLSEELLQQVTGGCKECSKDQLEMINHYRGYNLHIAHGDLAKSNGLHDQYKFHEEKANFYLDKALKAMERYEQREATDGHVILPEPQRPPGRRWIM